MQTSGWPESGIVDANHEVALAERPWTFRKTHRKGDLRGFLDPPEI